MLIGFPGVAKKIVVALLACLFVVPVLGVLLVVVNWFSLVAYWDLYFGKPKFYLLEEGGCEDPVVEAYAEFGLEVECAHTDAMQDYFYPRYRAYDRVISDRLEKSHGAHWLDDLARRSTEIKRNDSMVLASIQFDRIWDSLPAKKGVIFAKAVLDSKSMSMYRISYRGWDQQTNSERILFRIEYDTTLKEILSVQK